MRETLAERRTRANHEFNDKYIQNIDIAYKIINSYYRYCKANERLAELENHESTCDLASTKHLSDKVWKWYQRLNEYLKPYGLKMVSSGCSSFISKPVGDTGAIQKVFERID